MSKIVNDNDQIKSLFKSMDKFHEFEIIFHGMNQSLLSYREYILLTKYLKYRAKSADNLIITDTLDISYNPERETVFRCSIDDNDNINRIMKQLSTKKNHIIFKTLVELSRKNPFIKLMKKGKKREEFVDDNEFNVRFRLSSEEDVTSEELENLLTITETARHKIRFRYKQRTSFYVYNEHNEFVRIDLTLVKMNDSFNDINNTVPNYELEIEYGLTKGDNKNEKCLDVMYEEMTRLIKVLQQNIYITTTTVQTNVLNSCKEKFGKKTIESLNDIARQPQSLEIQHLTEILPNKYAVTDKADGERSLLYVYENKTYFISTNLEVKDSGIKIKMEKYNGTILDGELIFLTKYNRYLFLVFDCLYIGSDDVRQLSSLLDRLHKADDMINDVFIMKGQKQILYNIDFKSKIFDLNKIIDLQKTNFKNYIESLNHDIPIETMYPLIRRKYFMDSLGGKNCEIFAYTNLLWNIYLNDSTIQYPYRLDGLIFHPLIQQYIADPHETKLFEYKWKPSTKNSIDFYIEFEKDRKTGKILNVYDNTQYDLTKSIDSHDEYDEYNEKLNKANKIERVYRICNLYVGTKSGNDEEKPILFGEKEELYKAHLYLKNGEVRDIDDNIIIDNTVVEFYYNNDSNVNKEMRWVPIRTRHDKTDSVMKYHKKYGNGARTAEKIWNSIMIPINPIDFSELANETLYNKKIDELRGKIGLKAIVTTIKEDSYYQVKQKNISNMRAFHNFVKSIVISTFLNPNYRKNKHASVLDFGIGKGGDIKKYYHAQISLCVGIDRDNEGIVSPVDGAIVRYDELTKIKSNVPPMYFIHADPTSLLTYDDQNRILGGMDQRNKDLFDKFFPPDESKIVKFDCICSMFAIHYFLGSQITWDNFKKNINLYLKNGGLLLVSTEDARRIMKLIGSNNRYKAEITNDTGKKEIIYDIVKSYTCSEKDKVIGIGNPVDFYMSWVSELTETYITEYLVDYNFIVPELLKDCDLELIDSDYFDNLFHYHKEFFTQYAKYETVTEQRNFLLSASNYYSNSDINNVCYPFSSISRFYVFRKKDISTNIVNLTKETKEKKEKTNKVTKQKKQKGGLKFDIDTMNVGKMGKYDDDYSLYNSIHHVLMTQKIIPKTESMQELFKELNVKIRKNNKITKNTIKSIGDKLIFSHETEKEIKNVLDGVDIVIVEKDCNDEIDVEHSNEKNTKKILILKENDKYVPLYSSNKTGIFDSV